MRYFFVKVLFLVFLITVLVISSCNENNNYHGIPDVYVNFSINLLLPLYSNLNNIGGSYLYENEGYKGVIVYHNLDDTYLALEAACTYHPLEDCGKICIDQSGIFLRCGKYSGADFIECCASHYDMTGNVIQGPAIYPLKQYFAYRDGDMVYINN